MFIAYDPSPYHHDTFEEIPDIISSPVLRHIAHEDYREQDYDSSTSALPQGTHS